MCTLSVLCLIKISQISIPVRVLALIFISILFGFVCVHRACRSVYLYHSIFVLIMSPVLFPSSFFLIGPSLTQSLSLSVVSVSKMCRPSLISLPPRFLSLSLPPPPSPSPFSLFLSTLSLSLTLSLPLSFFSLFLGAAVAQSVEPATPGEEVLDSIPAVAARSLLVRSMSV